MKNPLTHSIFGVPVTLPSAVQIIVITVNGQKLLCIGPVIPGLWAGGSVVIDEVEFGDLVPRTVAMQLLDGSFTQGEVVQ